MNALKARVSWKKQLKPLIGILRIETEERLDFRPGQFCSLIIDRDGERINRPFSMSNLPGSNELEFYVKGYPDGDFTKHLLELGEGDELEVKGPYGSFVLQETQNEVCLICAGSGISPIMSIARALKRTRRKATLLQGARHADELGFREELEGMQDDYFKYFPTVSRPADSPGCQGRTGRVEEHLDLCENIDAEVYVCGPPPMVENVLKALKKKGFKEEKLFTEKYY